MQEDDDAHRDRHGGTKRTRTRGQVLTSQPAATHISMNRVAVSSLGQSRDDGPARAACNMRPIDAAATSLSLLAAQLAKATEPILVRNAMSAWKANPLSAVLLKNSAMRLNVVSGKGVTTDSTEATYTLSLAEYEHGLRQGSIPSADYVFMYVGNTSMATDWPELCNLFSQVLSPAHSDCRPSIHVAHSQRHTYTDRLHSARLR